MCCWDHAFFDRGLNKKDASKIEASVSSPNASGEVGGNVAQWGLSQGCADGTSELCVFGDDEMHVEKLFEIGKNRFCLRY